MNKRIKKKRNKESELEMWKRMARNSSALADTYWGFFVQESKALSEAKSKIRASEASPTLCSHSVEPNYPSPIGLETHRLQVNAPLCIDHTGPLHKNDVTRLADELAEALRDEAIIQLMPHISTGIPR